MSFSLVFHYSQTFSYLEYIEQHMLRFVSVLRITCVDFPVLPPKGLR